MADGETGIAISDAWIATVVPNLDGRSTIRFRATDTGRLVADVGAPIWVSAGAWTTAGLVVTGYNDRSMTADGGLVLVAPDPATTTVLVAGGDFDPRLGVPVARGDVLVSPSGTRVASNVCGLHLCDAQVVDIASGAVTRPVEAADGFLRVLTDDAVVTTDGDGGWISARGLSDGREIWRRPDSVLFDPVASTDGAVVAVTGSPRTGWGVASIDAHGAARDLGPRTRGGSWPRIWSALSDGTSVVIAGQSFGDWIGSGASLGVTVVDLRGSRPASTAVSIDLPAPSEWSR
jgi:hypothetical protein